MPKTPPGFEDDALPEEPVRDLGEESTGVDSSTPAGVVKQKRAIRKKKAQANEVLLALLKSPDGRDFLWSILKRGNPFNLIIGMASGVTPSGAPDTLVTAYNQGMQVVCEDLFREWLQISPEQVLLLLREHDPRFAAEVKAQG